MAITQTFSNAIIQGISVNNPTSLQYGPDGRLYISQQNGIVKVYEVTKNGDTWQASNEQTITLVNDIPNHDDNGDLSSQQNRQVTGLVVEGTAEAPILYVSSSDPRIGAGGGGNDVGLDTNSGIISRLTPDANGDWEVGNSQVATKVDLVIGLPRSEENHSTNGMDIRTESVEVSPGVFEQHQIMYVQSGGHDNKGAPSNNFAYTPEYYYSAALLRVDLTQLDEIEADEGLKGGTAYVDEYVYALPTLDDPTRTNTNGIDGVGGLDSAGGTTGPADAEAADTFGGNDGRNQAKFDADGPVQIYSPGYRNAYDVVITEGGNLYTFDNGPNNGWGGDVVDENGVEVTSETQVATNAPNLNDNTTDGDPDNLHIIEDGTYGGHPNPTRAAGEAAGLWSGQGGGLSEDVQLTPIGDPANDPNTVWDDLPADWNTITGGNTNPIEGVYYGPDTNPGPKDESLFSIGSSSNGLTEYTADNIGDGGPNTEYLAVASFNGDITLMEIETDGTAGGSTLTDSFSINVGGTPLDVTALGNSGIPGSGGVGAGALFVAQIGANNIVVLEPGDPPGIDLDADDDGVLDKNDPLQFDPENGTQTVLDGGETLFWDINPANGVHPGPGLEYNIGFSGWMIDGEGEINPDVLDEEPSQDLLTDLNNTIRGGAPGALQIKEVTEGDAYLATNTQNDALQTGFTPADNVQDFTIRVPIFNPYSSAGLDQDFGSVGFALGDGTQSNYLKVVAGVGGGVPQLQVFYEESDAQVTDIKVNGTEDSDFNDAATNATGNAIFNLYLTVDLSTPGAATAQAAYNYELSPGGGMELAQPKAIGGPILLEGAVLDAVLGQNTIQAEDGSNLPSSAVVTMLATSTGPEDPFVANFADLEITSTEKEVAPTAGDDEARAGVDEVLVLTATDLLSNDDDLNGDTLTIESVSNAVNGSAVLATDGLSVTFTPEPAGFSGSASFDYTINDGNGNTATATVDITVADSEVLWRINAGTGTTLAAITDQQDPDEPGSFSDVPWVGAGDGAVTGDGFTVNTGNTSTHDIADRVDATDVTNDPTLEPYEVPAYVPQAIYTNEKWDPDSGSEMLWQFGGVGGAPALVDGTYTVNLFMGNGFSGTSAAGQRVFDVNIEGGPLEIDGLDLSALLGHQVGGRFSYDVEVTDGTLDIEFIHDFENPLINGIEILGAPQPGPLPVIDILGSDQTVSEDGGTVDISIASDIQVPTGEQVDVTFEIASGTAVAGEDFEYTGGGTLSGGVYTHTLPIAGGSSDLTLGIDLLNDGIEETSEAFTVTITSVGSNATIGNASQAITITDDDVTPPAPGEVLYRVNAGGAEIAANDGDIAWSEDQAASGGGANGTANVGTPSPYLDLTAPATDTTFGAALSGTFSNSTGLSDALFTTERYSATANPDNMSYDFTVANGDYTVNLYAAEIWTGAQTAGTRVFDVEIEGQLAHDDVDLTADFGWNTVGLLTYDVNVTDGTLDLDFLKGAANNPKVSAIEIVAQDTGTSSVVSVGAPSPASVEEAGDTGVTTLVFPVTFDVLPSASTEVAYEVDLNGTVTSGTLALGVLDGEITVDVPNDDQANGDDNVTVTLTSVTDGPATLGTTSASGTVTEDDAAAVGYAPADDLDGDGITNENDEDIDGDAGGGTDNSTSTDGVLNLQETFAFDATDAGTALVQGETVTFDFETAGTPSTPFEAGFRGALTSPNNPGDAEVNLNNADVSGGTLNVTATAGDHFGNTNNQQNALVAAYTAPEGLSVETRFAIPDYDPQTSGDQAPQNYQSSGVVIGIDQNNLVKAVYGRGNAEFELAWDNGGTAGAQTTGGGTTPAGAAEVSIRMQVYVDDADAVVAEAVYTFYDDQGAVLETADTPIAPQPLAAPNAGAAGSLADLFKTGQPVGAGVIQTSTQSGNDFDVSYQYLTVEALGTPTDTAPTSVTLQNVASLPENSDTTSPVKVADIAVVDDGVSAVALSLAGVDAGLFEIQGTELFLSAGVTLDFEGQSSFDVSVVATDGVGNASSAPLGELVTDSETRDLPPAGTPADLPQDASAGTDEIDTVEYTGSDEVGTPAAPYQMPDTVENFDATGNGTVNVQGTSGDNVIGVGSGDNDTVDLTDGGSDVVTGTGSELNNTTVAGFGTDDQLIVENADDNASVVSVTAGSTILEIDTTGDGSADTTVTLEEDYTPDQIVGTVVNGGLVITANPAPTIYTTKLQAGELTVLDIDGDSEVRSPSNPENTPTGTGKENGIWIDSEDDEYLDLGGDAGDGAEFTYDASEAGTGTLAFRYANGGGGNRPMEVFVNDVLQGTVAFPSTTDWFNWEDIDIGIDLVAGENVIRFSQTGGAGPNIDFVTLETTVEPAADTPPAFDVAPATASVQENTTSVVADFDASDVDGQTVTYSLAGDDSGAFAIDGTTGELSFDPAPDFEAPTDTGTDNVYDVDVVATAGGVSTSASIAVTVEDLPSIASGNVADGDTDVALQPNFTFNFAFVNSAGIDELTITSETVKLIEVDTGNEVTSSVNGSGGNDALALTPLTPLDPNTDYQIVVDGVLDTEGRPLELFTATFTTGDDDGTTNPLDPAFIVNEQATIENVPVTSLEIGPDGSKLYAASIAGTLYRWDIDAADGTLSNQQSYNGLDGNAVIGLAFDPNSPDDLWLTKNLPVGDQPDFSSEIVRLQVDSGSAFTGTLQTMVTGLPRSVSDHLTNSVEFNAAGEMFVQQGGNSASGAADGVWGNRDERLLSAATLKVDHDAIAALVDGGAAAYDVTTDVQDADGGQSGEQATPLSGRNADGSVPGFYNPFANDALVTIHSTGIRNAYDLVWHSNGFLYVPTNGTGSQGNVPDDPATAFDESTVASGSPKPDLLFKSDADGGEYFGHPNPTRGEYIAFGGNPTSDPDPQQINGYPVGTQPDENFTEAAFDFGNGKSPNGSVEFTSSVFNGALQGALLTTRFSGGDDIFAFEFDANGDVVNQTALKDPDGNIIKFDDPLDVVTDASGRIYVIQYDRGSPFSSSIKLLTPDAPPVATAEIELAGLTEVATDDRIVFSGVDTVEDGSATADIANVATVTVSNPGTEDLVVSSIGVTGEFELDDATQAGGFTVTPGSSVDVTVNFTAATKGVFNGALTIDSNDADEGTKTVTLAGYNQPVLEGGQEPSVNEILQVFGYTTDLGDLANRDGDDGAAGDEVISAYWEAADSGSVKVTQLAAYTGPRDYAIQWFDENPLATDATDLTVNPIFAHAQSDSHTLLPDGTENDGPARDPISGTFAPTGPFGFSIFWNGDTDYTDPTFQTQDKGTTGNEALPGGDILMRMFQLRDADGNLVPNSYLLFQDYQAVNFDWNDNVYLVENVAPAGTVADTAPTAQVEVTDPVDANGDLVVTVTFDDDNAIDDATVEQGDLTLAGPSTPGTVVFGYDAPTDTATWTYSAPAGGWADGDYTATLQAESVSDDAGQGVAETAATTALDFTPIVPGDLVAAINVGSSTAYTRPSDGTVFVADPGPTVDSGSSQVRDKPELSFEGTVDDELYETYRFSDTASGQSFTYSFAVPNGAYVVYLYLAETFQTGTGQRSFDIDAEGTLIADDLDLAAEYGPLVGTTGTAGVLQAEVTVTDGTLDLSFLDDQIDNALVNAIEVRAAAAPDAAPTAQVVVTDPVDANGDLVVTVTLTDDNAIDDATVEAGDLTLSGPSTPGAPTFAYDAANDIATWTYAAPTGGWADGEYTATLQADSVSDDAGQGVAATAATTTLDLGTTQPGDLIAAINVGADAENGTPFEYVRPSDGTVFVADPGPSLQTGTSETNFRPNMDFVGTDDDDLFGSYRFSENNVADAFTYSIGVPQSGTYDVTLYIAEIFFDEVGERSYDILAEGNLIEDEFDPVAAFGPVVGGTSGTSTPGTLEFAVEVDDGTLDLEFADGAVNNALVSAIEVRALADPAVVDSFNGTVAPSDDWSNVNTAPDDVVLTEGANTLISTGELADADYVTFTVAAGQQVTSIELSDYVGGTDATFLGLQVGDTMPTQSAIEDSSATLDGGTVYTGAQVNTDLLPLLTSNTVEGAGQTTNGVSTPLEEGTYTLWFNQNQGLTESTLTITSEAEPSTVPGAYLPNADGDIVIEVEDIRDEGGLNGWQFQTEHDLDGPGEIDENHEAFNGDGFIEWDGSQFFGDPSNGQLSYAFTPDTSGVYYVNLRSSIEISAGTNPFTEHNDAFTRITDSNGDPLPMLPGYKNGEVVEPTFTGEGGNFNDGWHKTFQSGSGFNDWKWANKNVDNTGIPIAYDLQAGVTYNLEIAARSNNFAIDRAHLQFIENPPTGTQTTNAQNPPEFAEASPRDLIQPPDPVGEAVLTINNGSDGIQVSNFGNGSFVISNTGDKDIDFVEIDVADAILPDAVFDPFGVAGDTTGKIFTLQGGSDGGTGLVVPTGGFDTDAVGTTYLDGGGIDGFERIRLEFTDFNAGESISFGVDMDPNSIAGALKSTLDSGAGLDGAGNWDVGGVAGAELAGSTFTVGYSGGTTASGQLMGQGTGSQSGAGAIASEDSEGLTVALDVNGVAEGGEGTYEAGGPTVTVQGTSGETARIVLAKGFIVPFENNFPDTTDPNEYHDQLDAQLATLAASGFPANNVVEYQYVDVELDGTVQNIAGFFDFSDVSAFNLSEVGLAEGELPLGFAASVIDPSTGLAKGPVTSPVHLTFSDVPEADLSLTKTVSDETPDFGDSVSFTVTLTNDGADAATGVQVEDLLPSGFAFDSANPSVGTYDDTTGLWDVGSIADGATETLTITATVEEAGAAVPDEVIYRVNAGGAEVAAIDGGDPWTADTDTANSAFLANAGSNDTDGFPVTPGATVASSTPDAIFSTERWDAPAPGNPEEMLWTFAVAEAGDYEVRIFMGNGWSGASAAGARIFDVAIEGVVLPNLDDIDLSAQFGHQVGGMISNTVAITDGDIEIEFLHDVIQNPLVNGIEIIKLGSDGEPLDYVNAAEVIASDLFDPDSTPGNASGTEDDEASVTVTPIAGGLNLVTIAAGVDGAEPATNGQFVVSLEEVAATDTIVDYTVAGTATPGTDYETLAGLVTILAGETSAVIDVTVTDDLVLEDDETVIVSLTGASGDANLQLGTETDATVTIVDDELPPIEGSATLEITPGGGLGATTFGGSDKVQIANTGGVGDANIAQITIDFSTGILPDMVWDPTGSGGDDTAQVFTAGPTAAGVGLVAPGNTGPLVGADDADPFSDPLNGGWKKITLNFNDFNPGETFSFTSDVDPNSIQGVPNAGFSGAVSGYELIGSTVTITFDDGTTQQVATSSLFQDGSLGGAVGLGEAVLSTSAGFAAPAISLVGPGQDASTNLPGDQVYAPQGDTEQQILVTGAAGATVTLLQMDARLFIQSGADPFDVASDELPFYANEATAGKVLYTATLDGTGEALVDVNLLETPVGSGPDGGINHFVAVLTDGPYQPGDPVSQVSNTLVVTQAQTVEVAIAAVSDGAEAGPDAQFEVTLAEASEVDTVVSYSVAGTAVADDDYDALSGDVTILAGQTSALIDVSIIDDAIDEDAETVDITLTDIVASDGRAALDASTSASVSIQDNDDGNTAPEITSADSFEFVEGTAGPVFTVAANDPDSDPVTYALGTERDEGFFAIDENTGEVTLTTPPTFVIDGEIDTLAEVVRELSITVEASDGTETTSQDVTVEYLKDTDTDGVADRADNAIFVENADQRDSDSDGYGNIIDGDFNNDGSINGFDVLIFRPFFGATGLSDDDPRDSFDPIDPIAVDADFNGDGDVNGFDVLIFRPLFGQPLGASYVDLDMI